MIVISHLQFAVQTELFGKLVPILFEDNTLYANNYDF